MCRGAAAAVWPPLDIKGLGGFRRRGWFSIHGHREQDSLSVGSLLSRARHSHSVQRKTAAALRSRSLKKKKKKKKRSALVRSGDVRSASLQARIASTPPD